MKKYRELNSKEQYSEIMEEVKNKSKNIICDINII